MRSDIKQTRLRRATYSATACVDIVGLTRWRATDDNLKETDVIVFFVLDGIWSLVGERKTAGALEMM